ncbi:MAG: hypothetical protein J1F20_05635 [Muribaculaceae bacterium]|nr:hypothetical protein [Muribaculaceae bacterium]
MNQDRTDLFIEDSVEKGKMIDFLIFYKKISIIHTDKELDNKFPQIKPFINDKIGKQNLIHITREELNSYDVYSMCPNSIAYTVKYTKSLCFLRHLRNSIAHWNLNYQDDKSDIIIFKDFKDTSNKTLTCYGIIKEDTFKEIINEISKLLNENQ